MPNSQNILAEIQKRIEAGDPRPIDTVRGKYIDELSKYRKRPTLIYYSGFLQKTDDEYRRHLSVNDNDMNLLMNAIHCIKKQNPDAKSIDLLLHTPGGDMAATEAIINYLRSCFDEITCFVPQLAMSAGTTIACSCDKIFLAKHSSLGPVDPQLGIMTCCGIIEEYEYMRKEVYNDPKTSAFWRPFLERYHPSLIIKCYQVIELSRETLKKGLELRMFKESPRSPSIRKIVAHLAHHKSTKMHARHIDREWGKQLGLKIDDIENDQKLQDLIMATHHSCMHTFNSTSAVKIVKTNNNGGLILFINQQNKLPAEIQ